jgi:hypothetical protein
MEPTLDYDRELTYTIGDAVGYWEVVRTPRVYCRQLNPNRIQKGKQLTKMIF